MSPKLVFIYDGECPFCNHFAELLELKSGLPDISIMNGRENLSILNTLLEKGFDLDHGAILLNGSEIMHGAIAINWICSQIKNPSNSLLKIISITFSSAKRAKFFFPFLLIARRSLLLLRGVPVKVVANSNI